MLVRLTTALFWGLTLSIYAEPLKIAVSAEAAILMNADTGVILFQKNPHVLHYPASTTKVATVLWALKKAGNNLDVMVTAKKDVLGTITEEERSRSNYTLPAYLMVPNTSHMGLKAGETLSLRNLLYGVMVVSAGDASNVIAQHLSGSVPKFVDEVNAYVKELGCKNTLFTNPHGLYDPKHQTTVYDMALMTKEALKNPIFREIVATRALPVPKPISRSLSPSSKRTVYCGRGRTTIQKQSG